MQHSKYKEFVWDKTVLISSLNEWKSITDCNKKPTSPQVVFSYLVSFFRSLLTEGIIHACVVKSAFENGFKQI